MSKQFIQLTPYCGIDSLAAVALEFAADRIEWAVKVTRVRREPATAGQLRLRRKVAVRALADAQQQIVAAIALLEVEQS